MLLDGQGNGDDETRDDDNGDAAVAEDAEKKRKRVCIVFSNMYDKSCWNNNNLLQQVETLRCLDNYWRLNLHK